MSLEELRECQSELRECREQLEEESRRLAVCRGEKDDLELLLERLREIPEAISDWARRRLDAPIPPREVEDMIVVILEELGVNPDLYRGLRKQRRVPLEEAERFEAWAETYAETAPRAEIEYGLAVCIELLEGCREELERVRDEAEECERRREENNALAERLRRELPELLAYIIADYISEMLDVTLEESDEREIASLVEEHLNR